MNPEEHATQIDINEEILKEEKVENTLTLMDSLLQKATSTMMHFDTQTNILIGITIAISALALSRVEVGEDTYAFVILSFFSILATFVCLYAVHPPKRMTKRGQQESLFYNKHISTFVSAKEYTEHLRPLLKDKELLLEEYSKDIYNIYKYHCGPKRRLFNIARTVLFMGIFLSAIVYVGEHFLKIVL